MRRLYSLALAATVYYALLTAGCASLTKSATAQHNLRLANADLAAALNKVEATALQASQAGTLPVADTIVISQVVNNATYLSDSIETCIDKPPAAGTISGCISPLVTEIQQNMTPASLGIKSSNATAIFQTVLAGVQTALAEITAKEGGL